MKTTYRAGNWYVLTAPGVIIALPPATPTALVTRLWEQQSIDHGLAAVIDALSARADGSVADLTPFAAIVLEGSDARVAVRGEVSVEITGSAGIELVSGADVTTWSERFVPGAERFSVSIPGDEADGDELPVTGGIVRAAFVGAVIETSDLDVAESEPEPATEPEPAAESEPAAEPEPTVEPEAERAVDDAVDPTTLLPTEVTYASDIDEFAQLFGETVHSPNAFVRPIPAAPPAPPAPAAMPAEGDHDGATISAGEARALRADPPSSTDAPTAVLPVVGSGTNAGRIRVSTGQIVSLDRTVIIGRRPRSTRASGASLPHLVAVESPQQDISRSHLEIRPEGDTVLAIDLNTTNGSTLLRPGADPLRLHPGEQTVVLTGDVIDLGDGVTVVFEDLP